MARMVIAEEVDETTTLRRGCIIHAFSLLGFREGEEDDDDRSRGCGTRSRM